MFRQIKIQSHFEFSSGLGLPFIPDLFLLSFILLSTPTCSAASSLLQSFGCMCSCPALAQYGYNLGLSCWVQVRKLTYGLAFPAWLQTKCITMDLSGSQEHWLPWLPFAYLLCSIRVPWDGALALDSRLCLLLIVRKIYQSFPQRRNQFHESNCQWAKMEAHITWICKWH